jgi:hypothetical protein
MDRALCQEIEDVYTARTAWCAIVDVFSGESINQWDSVPRVPPESAIFFQVDLFHTIRYYYISNKSIVIGSIEVMDNHGQNKSRYG